MVSSLERCAEHGLSFDSNVARGCVLCRRIESRGRQLDRRLAVATVLVVSTYVPLISRLFRSSAFDYGRGFLGPMKLLAARMWRVPDGDLGLITWLWSWAFAITGLGVLGFLGDFAGRRAALWAARWRVPDWSEATDGGQPGANPAQSRKTPAPSTHWSRRRALWFAAIGALVVNWLLIGAFCFFWRLLSAIAHGAP
jgi:hypothetical protein